MTNTKILLPFFIFLILLTIFSLNIPFFWDSAFFSSLSVEFYSTGLNGFIAPEEFDTGGFPLYSVYLTAMWKCFGKTLLVSHFAVLPFLLGIVYEFYKLANRYLNEKTIALALVLLVIQPVFITQSILMGYDIIILYFFLLSLNALYNNRTILYPIALILLCLISIRGIMLASALFIFDLILNKKINLNFLRNYFPSIIILFVWTVYHKQETGWFLFSPIREDNHEQFSGTAMMLRQFLYVVWKNLDLGVIALWMIFIFSSFYFLKKTKSTQHKELLRFVLIAFSVLTLFMILIKNPIGNKYFLVVFVLLILAVCYFIQQIEKRKVRLALFAMVIISLIAGNFILYPQRYGNAWDSSLKIIPYFKIENEMKEYILKNNLSSDKIASQFPLTIDFRYSQLSDSTYQYSDIEEDDIDSYPYFLYSNIINTNRIEELEEIKNTWIVEKEIISGMIELVLYKNPNF